MSPFIQFFQQYGPLFGVLIGVAAVLGLSFSIYKAAHNRHIRELREQVQQKDREIAQLKKEGYGKFRAINEQLQDQLKQAKEGYKALPPAPQRRTTGTPRKRTGARSTTAFDRRPSL